MEEIKKTSTPYKKIIIKGKYEDFVDFYDENKGNIYKAICDVFEGFKGNRKRSLTLYVSALIRGLEWDTEFKFNRNDTVVLTRDVLPYFEQNEDYETCLKIKKLYDELTISK